MKVSVIMPVYNGAQYLENSLNSVLNQTVKNFELLCIDDESTDNSAAIIKKYQLTDRRIRYIHKENGGPSSALNLGIELAGGEFISFIDQDDEYKPNYLEAMINLFDKEGNSIDVAVCSAEIKFNDGTTRRAYPICSKHIMRTLKEKKQFGYYYIPQWTKLIRKKFLEDHRIVFPGRQNKAHDLPVHFLTLYLAKAIGYTKEPLYIHTVHSEQISANFNFGQVNFYSYQNLVDYLGKELQYTDSDKFLDFILPVFFHAARCGYSKEILNILKKMPIKTKMITWKYRILLLVFLGRDLLK